MSEKYVIGIDLGGTNTVIGLVDVKGHILAKDDSIKTQAHPDIEEYTDSIALRLCGLNRCGREVHRYDCTRRTLGYTLTTQFTLCGIDV